MRIYYEKVPDHYTGNYPAVTIKYREQDKEKAVEIGSRIGGDGAAEVGNPFAPGEVDK